MANEGGNRLLLASSSVYRKALLARLVPEFNTFSPDIDESHLTPETPKAMALRLAASKAHAALNAHPDHVVIASDQVCALGQRPHGKPENFETNVMQLQSFSGQVVDFYTAVVVGVHGQELQQHLDRTKVRFRTLSEDDIVAYVEREQAFDCAGGFKVEGLGPILFESVESNDPTGLVGLPLIATARMLRNFGVMMP